MISQRDNLVQTLLDILNQAAQFGVGPSAKEFVQKRPGSYGSSQPDLCMHIPKTKS